MESLWNALFARTDLGEWRELPPMKSKRHGCAAATLGDATVVVMGGHDGKEETDTVECYCDDENNTGGWINTTPMRSKRLGCVAATLSSATTEADSIVVVGGHDGQGSLHTAERYNPRLGMWTILPPMQSSRRFDFAAASIGSRIYVAGGHDGKSCTNTVEMFGAESSRWASVVPMREKRFQCSATAVGSKVYVVGGDNGDGDVLDSCEVYDTQTGTWSSNIPPMKNKRKGCVAATVGGSVYVFGGHNGKQSLNTAEKYDPISNSWSWLPSMKYKRFGAAVAVMERRIFVLGGFDGTATLASVEEFTVNSPTETSIPIIGACTVTDKPVREETMAPSLAPLCFLSGDKDGVPADELLCPITGDLMVDPVVASDGHSYEREAIEAWFSQFPFPQNPRSPKTNETIGRTLFPNHNLKSLCRSFHAHEGNA